MCYPAKLSHGHIMNLLAKHPDFIWMPCSKWERQEDETAGNHFNCPIVASYPEALRLNIDELRETDVAFVSPWVPYHDKDKLAERLVVELTENFAKETNGCGPALTADEIRAAVEAAPEYVPGKPEIVDCKDFTEATLAAAKAAESGDVVLMSPASAAFDQFKNFMVRGEYYKKLIKEL